MRFSVGQRYMLASVGLATMMNVIVKFLTHIPVFEVVLFRAVVSLVLGAALIKQKGLSFRGNNTPWLIGRGVMGTIALVCYFWSVQKLPLATAVSIHHLAPLLTVIFAGFFVHETSGSRKYFYFLISFTGILIIYGFDHSIQTLPFLSGLLAATSAATSYNIIRKLRNEDDHTVIVFYFSLVALPLVAPFAYATWVTPGLWDVLLLLSLGVIVLFMQLFLTKSYQLEPANRVAQLNYLGVVFAIGIGFFAFGDNLPVTTYLGIGFILFGVILSSRGNS